MSGIIDADQHLCDQTHLLTIPEHILCRVVSMVAWMNPHSLEIIREMCLES